MKTRLTETLGVDVPIVQAPMAGATGAAIAIAVAEAGGLGSLPCAMLSADAVRREVAAIREGTDRPVNVNFFCHVPPTHDADQEARWDRALAPYYREFGVERDSRPSGPARELFDAAACELLEELRPAIVSFHFGLPERGLLERVRTTGAVIMSSATTVDEARPPFPLAAPAMTRLRVAAEQQGSSAFCRCGRARPVRWRASSPRANLSVR